MKEPTISILSVLTGMIAGVSAVGITMTREREKAKTMSDKHLALFLMMNQWVRVKQEGKNLATYFKKNNYHRIAIYGMSYAGETLAAELKDTEIEVAYGIDQKAEEIYSDIEVLSLEDAWEDVDALIVTPIFFMNEIEKKLSVKFSCPIVSLEDILYEI